MITRTININNLSNQEYSLYARHLILDNIGINGQTKLKNAKILIIGAGGLSSPAIIYLAASGIGYIGIIDHDNIDISNLNRQILYNHKDIAQQKTLCAELKIQDINPKCKVIKHTYKLTANNAREIIKHYNIVLDGSDNFKTRHIVSKFCYQLHKTHVYAGVQQFEGQMSVLNYKSSMSYFNIYTEHLYLEYYNCNDNGLLGVITGTIGILQATESLKIFLGFGTICTQYILMYNLLNLSFTKLKISPIKSQKVHSNNRQYKTNKNKQSYPVIISQLELQIMAQNNNSIMIIDIRDSVYFRTKHLMKSINIPFYKINLNNTLEFIQNFLANHILIIYCSTMYRALIISYSMKHYKIPHYILKK
uniref:Molybdopterin biosynthesis protein n=1 Tax=Bornetia secundiflora TaxID=2575637 RepID=A0A4D6WMT5_9FLOR|nr:Molybdopterin biosynthesis protein [Bornetia secundiflora]